MSILMLAYLMLMVVAIALEGYGLTVACARTTLGLSPC
jgi:hypothetical protein